MTRGLSGVPALLLLALAGGCVYLNSVYNAERIFEVAERDRLAGREALARARYDSVVVKAARSYRKDPDGSWSDDALYLLGRAYLRTGDLGRAEEALRRARAATDDEQLRLGAGMYLGVVAAHTGDRTRGIGLLNDAIGSVRSSTVRGEGHLWRARILLAEGRVGEGWWDLDRAGEADRRLAVAADVERVVWGIAHADTLRARRGADRLLGRRDAWEWGDTLRALVTAASGRWGPGVAAAILRGASTAAWPPAERDRTLLLRARLLAAAGDTAAAETDLALVATGVGAEAVEGRLSLAGLRLSRATRVADLDAVRPVLLPAVGDPRVLGLLEAMRKVELLERDAGRPGRDVALFAAAELARDVLAAPALARFLFLAYADRSDPWRGKGLLAAVALARDPVDRDMMLARLPLLGDDPYALAARAGRPPPEAYARLEQDLRAALARVLADAEAAAAELDVLVRERSDTVR